MRAKLPRARENLPRAKTVALFVAEEDVDEQTKLDSETQGTHSDTLKDSSEQQEQEGKESQDGGEDQ